MKKIVLGIVFVFAVFTTIKAAVLVKGCGQIAFELQADLEDNGVDMDVANELASKAYLACKGGK